MPLLLFILTAAHPFSAQALNSTPLPSFKKAEAIKKTLLDTALFRVYYDYSFPSESDDETDNEDTDTEKQESATTLLQIGKNGSNSLIIIN